MPLKWPKASHLLATTIFIYGQKDLAMAFACALAIAAKKEMLRAAQGCTKDTRTLSRCYVIFMRKLPARKWAKEVVLWTQVPD